MNCPVCDESHFENLSVTGSRAAARCTGCGCVALASAAEQAGTKLERAEAAIYRDILTQRGCASGCDQAILLDRLQTQPDPAELLVQVHAALRPGDPLLVTIPSQWQERPNYRWHFDVNTIQLLLLRYGFNEIQLHRNQTVVTALRTVPAFRPKCSILVAAFNESRTFSLLIDALLRKQLPGGLDREIVIIESHSTDGTRELAQQYQSHPDVKLILQERPLGKGHAIREGLRHATGEIILIQDADLEYDLADYDALLAPILSHRALFVLGTRHSGVRKIRHFAEQKSLAATMNFGHAFFTGLINLLYRQQMTDPFTMYKVFHRDCLFGLEFRCNRFDFDHELVIKFVRKGYRPLEIPVNYSSRSFREGKKVRLFRDPLTWLWVDLKLRFTRR